MNLLYNTTRFFISFYFLTAFAFAQAQDFAVTPTAAVTDGQGEFTELDGAWGITTVVIGESTYALVVGYYDDGVQIINITDPENPTATAVAQDGQGGFTALAGPRGITTVVIDNTTYALVASRNDDGVQIINITDPENPTATAAVTDGQTDGQGGQFTELDGPRGITTVVIDNTTYALVASSSDDGVQIMDITDPENPTATAVAQDGQGGFTELDGAYSVTTVVIGESTYALVTSYADDGVQIIDISTPASPTATAAVTDGQGGFTELDGASSITTVVIDNTTYALVASYLDDGVQIINITDPENPTATAAVTDGQTDGQGGQFTELDGAQSITTVVIGEKTYALVASYFDNGVQIIDISTPASPTASAVAQDGQGGFTELYGARGITTVVIGEKTYALVASYFDNGVQIMDITDPENPTATAAVVDGQGGFTELYGARGITTVVIGEKTYALVGSFSDDGVQIMEMSVSSLSTGEPFFTSLTLYPNPVTSHLHIDNPQSFELSYTVYDLTGKALSTHHITGQSHSIDVSTLAKGVYLLEATHNNNTTAMQFVKE